MILDTTTDKVLPFTLKTKEADDLNKYKKQTQQNLNIIKKVTQQTRSTFT